MKSHLGVLLLAGGLALAPSVRAQAAGPCPAQDSGAETRFNGALRLGLGITSGTAYRSGPSMGSLFAPQVQLGMDLGSMASRHVFLGVYLEAGVGRQMSELNALGAKGRSATARLGLQLQYHLEPGKAIRPWLGYGVGLSGALLTDNGTGPRYTGLLGGIEYAHFMGGLDLQLDHEVALGVFVDYTIGEYFLGKRVVNGVVEFSGALPGRGVHQWLQVGPRLTF